MTAKHGREQICEDGEKQKIKNQMKSELVFYCTIGKKQCHKNRPTKPAHAQHMGLTFMCDHCSIDRISSTFPHVLKHFYMTFIHCAFLISSHIVCLCVCRVTLVAFIQLVPMFERRKCYLVVIKVISNLNIKKREQAICSQVRKQLLPQAHLSQESSNRRP